MKITYNTSISSNKAIFSLFIEFMAMYLNLSKGNRNHNPKRQLDE